MNLVRAGQMVDAVGDGDWEPVGSLDLVCLRFVYILAVRIVTALRLCRRDEDHKTVEILLLRQQLAVLQRQLAAAGRRPRPAWYSAPRARRPSRASSAGR